MEHGDVKHPEWMYTTDFFFNKVLPKKFLIVVIATVFAGMGIITGLHWVVIAGAYAGFNLGQKILEKSITTKSTTKEMPDVSE